MLHGARTTAGLGATALLLALPLAAHAAGEDDDAAVRIPLSVSVEPHEDGGETPESGPFCALTLTVSEERVELVDGTNLGDRLAFSGALPTVTVSDRRSAQQAAGGGWTVSGQASDLTSDRGSGLTAGHLGWTPAVVEGHDGVAPGSPVASVLRAGPGLLEPATLASASHEAREGIAELSAELSLDVPIGTTAGHYTGTLTLSLFPTDEDAEVIVVDDDPCAPGEVDPEPTPEPEPTDPEPTPEPTDPVPTDPEPTEPAPTEPAPGSQGGPGPRPSRGGGSLADTGQDAGPLAALILGGTALILGGAALARRHLHRPLSATGPASPDRRTPP